MAEHHAELPRDPESPAAARLVIGEWLAADFDPGAIEDVKLLVSEIVTNAVRHPRASGRIAMTVRTSPGRVRVEVADPGGGFTPKRIRPPAPDALGGRGLLIVDRVASRWGVSTGSPTRVWFELEA